MNKAITLSNAIIDTVRKTTEKENITDAWDIFMALFGGAIATAETAKFSPTKIKEIFTAVYNDYAKNMENNE